MAESEEKKNQEKDDVQIQFRGTVNYREAIQHAAWRRQIRSAQALLELLVREMVGVEPNTDTRESPSLPQGLEIWLAQTPVPIKPSSHENSEPSSHGELPHDVIKHTSQAVEFKPRELYYAWKLRKVLRSGKTDFIKAVTSNLDIFARYCNGEPGPDDEASSNPVQPPDEAGGGKPKDAPRPHPKPSGTIQEAREQLSGTRRSRRRPERVDEPDRGTGNR